MNETQRALMEGERNAASDEYFGARPQIDTTDRRRLFEAGFERAWNALLPRMMNYMELVLIRGLPGSGKTTMARVLALVGYEHHEADHYFERGSVYVFNKSELPKAHSWCLERAKNSIARGARCVVANTFTRRCEMQPYFDAAKAAGVPVRVIEARGEWRNCHGVPADAIERMRARWETLDV